MKQSFLITVLLCASLSAGCSSGSSAGTAPSTTSNSEPTEPKHVIGAIVDWADVLKFDGITYLATYGDVGRPLKKEDLGPKFAEVRFRLQGNINDPEYRTKNGDAGYLDPGTPVYVVKGYDPSFRLAAYDGKTLKLYEVLTNPKAEEVSDLLDIKGKVRYIGVNGPKDHATELATIRDPEEVNSLVSVIMEAPLERAPGSFDDSGKVYFLVFYLEDGTATVQTYYADLNAMYLGLTLPEEFQKTIERSLRG